jgi:hypothetical protein
MNRIGPAAGEDRSAHTRQTFLYFGSLTLFLYLATPVGYPRHIQENFAISILPEEAVERINEAITSSVRFNSVVDTGVPGFIARGR